MLFLYLAFLLGIDSETEAGCIAATFLLHYFVLTTVFWMGVEARHMYITLVSESDRVGRKFMIKAGFFSWGKSRKINSQIKKVFYFFIYLFFFSANIWFKSILCIL